MNRFGYFILLVGLALTLFLFEAAPSPWQTWSPDICRTANCYCEPIRADRFVAQPVSTYTNLGFITVALFVLWATFQPAAPTDSPFSKTYGLLYGAVLLCTGLFSFFYHASLTRLGDFLDLMGTYLFLSFLFLYNLHRLRPFTPAQFAVSFLIINIVLALGLIVAYNLQQVYFVILIVGALAAEALSGWADPTPRNRRWLGVSLALFALGASVWTLDTNVGLPCWPNTPFIWHGLWHLSAAGAALAMYLYYSSTHSQRRTTAL